MTLFPTARTGAGLVFTSGLAAIDPTTMTVSVTDFHAQAAAVFDQLDAALLEFGSSRDRVLKLDCFLAERQWFPAWNTAFSTYFTTAAPARTTTITTLPIEGLLIEVQAIAVAESRGRSS
ncbi:RidA family protein [Nocardia acidivorans]|uniref:RidA family protein n=1 Tax=Nocardia acidivorans TaxID=404580 RepID=UPI000834FEDB|nr:RidA family protein [Nocardia acidivorans]